MVAVDQYANTMACGTVLVNSAAIIVRRERMRSCSYGTSSMRLLSGDCRLHSYKKWETVAVCISCTMFYSFFLATVLLSSSGLHSGHAAVELDYFSPDNDDGEFQFLAVGESFVLVATDFTLYRLSLDLEDAVTRSFPSTTRLLALPSASGSASNYDGTAIRCGAGCTLLNVTDSAVVNIQMSGRAVLPTDSPGDDRVSSAIGTLMEGRGNGMPNVILTYALNNFVDRLGSSVTQTPSQIMRVSFPLTVNSFSELGAQIESNPLQERAFLHTFSRNGFTYFVSVMIFPSGQQTRISRVPNMSPELQPYIELELVCRHNGRGFITAATFLPSPNAFGFDAVVVSSSMTQLSEVRVFFCAFNLGVIDDMIRGMVNDCANGIGVIGLARESQSPCQGMVILIIIIISYDDGA